MDKATKHQPWHLVAGLVTAVCAISMAAIFFKLAQPTHPLVSAATRLSVAGVILLPLSIRAWQKPSWRQTIAPWAMVGGFLYAVHFGSWVASLAMTTVASSVTLVCITPLFLTIWAWITGKDKPQASLLAAMAVASLGVGLIGYNDAISGQSAWVGDLFALAGALSIAPYLLLIRRLGPELDVWPFIGTACLVGATLLWTSAGVTGVTPMHPVSWGAFAALALSALIPQLVGHTLLAWSLRHISPTKVAVVVLAEPIIASVLGLWVLHEALEPLVVAGGLITLLAVGGVLALESMQAKK